MPKHPAISKRTHDGFTLIELLVVISIIALLIAMLLPALGQAKEVSRQIKCQANMRSLHLGVSLYGQDNRTYLPPAGLDPTAPGAGEVSNGSWSTPTWRQMVAPYIGDTRALAFACPSNPAGNTGPVSTADFRRNVRFSYTCNGRNFLAGSTTRAPMNWQNLTKFDSLIRPAALILLAEGGWDVDPAVLNNSGNPPRWFFVHRTGTAGFGSADGHVTVSTWTATTAPYNQWSITGRVVSAGWASTLVVIDASSYPAN